MKKMNKKGFTIVELVIVIAVIGILATVLIPTFSGVIGDATDESIRLGARNAFVEYTATNTDQIGGDFVYIDGTKAVAIDDGQLVLDDEGKVAIFDTVDKALAVFGTTTTGEGASAVTTNNYKQAATAVVDGGKLFKLVENK